MDGGHMIVPSIGQDTSSCVMATISCLVGTSGRRHIVPITWQKAKTITSTMERTLTQENMFLSTQTTIETIHYSQSLSTEADTSSRESINRARSLSDLLRCKLGFGFLSKVSEWSSCSSCFLLSVCHVIIIVILRDCAASQ